MKLTHKMISDYTWKAKCFPFLVLGILVPLATSIMTVFALEGILIGAALLILFGVFFVRGYLGYQKVKSGSYVLYKQECTGDFLIADNSSDSITTDTKYSVFGRFGTYKHNSMDKHVGAIKKGDVFYLLVLRGTTKIFTIFPTSNYTLNTEEFSSEDQCEFIPNHSPF